jgi:hypothetical protein
MTKLEMPKIEIKQKDIVKRFQEVCTGFTIVAVYAILWLLIGALGYRIFLWVF